ncbi:hypothetical protein [Egicoccus sp. AB-alg6-2]|uniref:hypothetical protein n=1 Tax=Egicoccus sp. AB-alg6-2 TaxID=3242692 RepID=UPI00359E22DF
MGGLDYPTAVSTVPVADHGDTPSRLAFIAVPFALAAVLAACSTGAPTSTSVREPDATDNSAAAVETETPDAPPTAEPSRPDEDELAATWEAFHTAWVEQASVDDPDPAEFQEVAVDPDRAIEALVAQRGDSRLVTSDTELWPRFQVTGDQASITDCAIVAQHPDGQPDSVATVTTGWEATAVATNDGWRIDTAQQRDLFCIAEELNDQLLAAYRDFRAAKDAAWDPPDPGHPELERTMTGAQLEFIRDLLTEHQRDGIVIRDPAPTDNAVVFEVGIGAATVSDCARQVPERGAFDLETGTRLDDLIPPVQEGQLDLQSVELRRGDDGVWRVSDQAGTRDTNCEPGSTRYVVQ